jgi:hypothetical protein
LFQFRFQRRFLEDFVLVNLESFSPTPVSNLFEITKIHSLLSMRYTFLKDTSRGWITGNFDGAPMTQDLSISEPSE